MEITLPTPATHLGEEVGRRPLTADPSGAVHQHLLVSEQVQVLVNVSREVAEFTDVGGQAAGEPSLGGHEGRTLARQKPVTEQICGLTILLS